MPLQSAQVWQVLTDKQAEFYDADQASGQILQTYRQALGIYSRKTAQQLDMALLDLISPGARPLEALGHHLNWVMAAQLQWQNREQSLDWVQERLGGIATFAVDGSQILPSKELSLPVALVQVGWFENPHLPDGRYVKDVRIDVMTPAELQDTSFGSADRQVNLRRFEMEIACLIDYIAAHSGQQDRLVFLDGSLVATFAEVFDPSLRREYIHNLLLLLRASETHNVPLVAYIDTSSASDLCRMLQLVAELPPTPTLTDANLLAPLMAWGDRTPFFLCDRAGKDGSHGVLSQYAEQAEQIGFVYLKTNDGPPARLEFPRWVYEAGLLDRCVDWVRGEVVIGGGYPYVIETADQTAVLQANDRQSFLRILQEWAEQEALELRFSRKMISKVRRR